MNPCPALRSAGFAKVIDGYLGSGHRFSKHLEDDMQRFMTPQTEVEQSVGDALILLHISGTTGDSQLLLEARKRHITGIWRLRKELLVVKDPDSILAAAQILLGCEYYSAVSSGSRVNVWTSHVNGISALLYATEKHTPVEESYQRRFSLQQARHIALIHSLVCREATPGIEYWHKSPDKLLHNETEELIRLALRLPGLLQAADLVAKRATPSTKGMLWTATDAQSALQLLKKDLECWYSQSGMEYYFWNDRTGALVYQAPNSPGIAQVPLCFTSPLYAAQLGVYWTCLLLLNHAWLCVSHVAQHRFQACQLSLAADSCADMLCKSIPYLLNTADGHISKALAVRAPLHFAKDWWRKRDQTKLLWCNEVELQLRKEVPYLNWDALLPCTFSALYISEPEGAEVRSLRWY